MRWGQSFHSVDFSNNERVKRESSSSLRFGNRSRQGELCGKWDATTRISQRHGFGLIAGSGNVLAHRRTRHKSDEAQQQAAGKGRICCLHLGRNHGD
jgi:hypothetical protein